MTDPSFCTHDFVHLSTYLTYPYLSIPIHTHVSSWKPRSASTFGWQKDMARQDGARAPRHGSKTSESPVLNSDSTLPSEIFSGAPGANAVQMLCKDALFCWASKVWLSSLRGIRWGSDSSWRHRTTQGTTNDVAVASGRAKVEKPKRSSELTSHLKASESIWNLQVNESSGQLRGNLGRSELDSTGCQKTTGLRFDGSSHKWWRRLKIEEDWRNSASFSKCKLSSVLNGVALLPAKGLPEHQVDFV